MMFPQEFLISFAAKPSLTSEPLVVTQPVQFAIPDDLPFVCSHQFGRGDDLPPDGLMEGR
jgi:hypothetical protein